MAVGVESRLPRISVIIPLYNKSAYIQDAIMSVLGQGELASEIIVVDDGSSDNGAELVQAMAKCEPKIRLVRQANAGVSVARNLGIAEARGEFVAFLDADDCYLPDFLSEIVRMINLYPDAGLYATGYMRIRHGLGCKRDDVEKSHFKRADVKLIRNFFWKWSKGSFFFTSSICMPRRLFVCNGIEFPRGENLGEDQDVWFRIAECHQVVYSPRQLSVYRTSVPGRLSIGGVPDSIVPSYRRLSERITRPDFPSRHIAGARRLLAVHNLNIANAHIAKGKKAEALGLMFNRVALHHPIYWLRTLIRWLRCRGE